MVWTYNNMESRDRKRQIDTLKIFNDCVVEVTENSEYEVEFTSGDNQIRIEVVLGPEFPNEKPILRVNPMVSHPWITPNTRDIIGAPGLLNFTTHSDLGRVVQAIIRDFKRTPPPLVMVEDSATSAQAAAPLAPALTAGSSVPGFDNLSNEELELMYKHPEYMDKFIEGLPASTEMENNLNKAMEDIEILAKENLEKDIEIAKKKEALNQRIDHVSQLKKRFEEKYFQHKKLTQAYTPKAIVESLHNLATQADRDAENIAKEFLAGNMDLDTFLKNYTEKRSLGLKRRIKEDRLANQLAQLNRAGLSSK